MNSDILSDIKSDILSDIDSDILSDKNLIFYLTYMLTSYLKNIPSDKIKLVTFYLQ